MGLGKAGSAAANHLPGGQGFPSWVSGGFSKVYPVSSSSFTLWACGQYSPEGCGGDSLLLQGPLSFTSSVPQGQVLGPPTCAHTRLAHLLPLLSQAPQLSPVQRGARGRTPPCVCPAPAFPSSSFFVLTLPGSHYVSLSFRVSYTDRCPYLFPPGLCRCDTSRDYAPPSRLVWTHPADLIQSSRFSTETGVGICVFTSTKGYRQGPRDALLRVWAVALVTHVSTRGKVSCLLFLHL